MTDAIKQKVVPGGESAGLFDAVCSYVRDSAGARCVVVIIIDGTEGSGYSVVGPLKAQVVLLDILYQMADALDQQFARNLQ